jgi:hypothetical protein
MKAEKSGEQSGNKRGTAVPGFVEYLDNTDKEIHLATLAVIVLV